MNKKPFYITTPIYYPSGNMHIGHCYTTVAADVMARFKRLQGYDVFFLTGTDEHGQKIEHCAKSENLSPKQYVDKIAGKFKAMWDLMGISNDIFFRTTDDSHKKAVQKIFKTLFEKGKIYKGKYKGWYCTPCEAFFTEIQLKDKKCPDCGRDVKLENEEAYFFKLSEYADKLLEFYSKNPHFIGPQSKKNEMIQFIKDGLDDLCVSRTSFSWGIPVDFDISHVIYVWIDALSNYITALGYGTGNDTNYKKFWPADVHFVGKEIIRFHAIIWPAILMALDLPLPKQIFSHGWILFDGDKMSKSKGNVVDPYVLCERYGVDAVRYFLMREFPFGPDGNFNNELLVKRINFDLANDLGNLLSRATAMGEKYFGGRLASNRKQMSCDAELINMAKELKVEFEGMMNKFKFSVALEKVWLLISKCNKYIDENAPWDLAKNNETERLSTVLYNVLEALRIVSILISPFVPGISKKIQNQIGAGELICSWENANVWGLLPVDAKIKKGEAVFLRIDVKKEIEELDNLLTNNKNLQNINKNNTIKLIDIEYFAKIELTVAKVEACEKLKKSKKLLKLMLFDGLAQRIVVSGLAEHYKPEEIVGRHVIIVSNLKPVKLCGIESNGMILAADCNENGIKIIVADDIPAGSKIG